ncbi:hypothetical protein DPMN_141749 [Dreissena polymorpha]|uniref:Uncharacterized protein n=1 Tax=Dreissena polymorpha TaxID=45954 RepID=A0A9D4GA22_DREPO|nr:hypothetical protein DPMN_141749 [Dreissena polymorpha]
MTSENLSNAVQKHEQAMKRPDMTTKSTQKSFQTRSYKKKQVICEEKERLAEKNSLWKS